ncbi:MAG: hypothetical protein HY558_01835 [Euryarchaeota archaeon]|nr:hypothetical protein [Euryarchaeota archaeon]
MEPFLRARRTLLQIFAGSFLVIALGKAWDGAWHVTQGGPGIDDFWSPPHLFVYTGSLLLVLLVARGAIRERDSHAHLQPLLQVPPLGFPIPACHLMSGSGLLLLFIAGMLDSRWHTDLGLRETHWSLPHLLIGSGIFLLALGIATGLVALHRQRPARKWTLPLAGLFLFSAASGWLLGPISDFTVPEEITRLLAMESVARQPDLTANLLQSLQLGFTRAHPLLVPVQALLSACLLTALRRWDTRRWAATRLALLYTLIALLSTLGAAGLRKSAGLPLPPGAWPFPMLPMALLLELGEKRLKTWTWPLAGLLAGVLYRAPPGPLIAAVGTAMLGKMAGDHIGALAESPQPRRIGWTWAIVAAGVPLALGGVDIWLRYGKYWWIYPS